MKKATLDFNKELLIGECGAFFIANLLAYITSRMTANNNLISLLAVIGTLMGGALFWLIARIYNKTRSKSLKKTDFIKDISYFTPAAIILGIVVYDPILYFVSHYFLNTGNFVEFSVITGQLIAFISFLGSMNLYRWILIRFKGKIL